MKYLRWRIAQLWALKAAFRVSFNAMVQKKSLREFFWHWRWWMAAWHAIEVGRILGEPGAYYGTDGAIRRRTARASKRLSRLVRAERKEAAK